EAGRVSSSRCPGHVVFWPGQPNPSGTTPAQQAAGNLGNSPELAQGLIRKKKGLKTDSLSYEHDLTAQGYRIIAGIDEAGRGAWAGLVVAGAVWRPHERYDLPIITQDVRDIMQLYPRNSHGSDNRTQNSTP